MNRFGLHCALVSAVILSAGAVDAKTTLQASTGVSYSSGDYGGTEDTNVTVIPMALKLKTGNWAFRASLPYLHVDGPANVSAVEEAGGGGGATVDPGPGGARNSSVNGIGDLSLTATYTFNDVLGDKSYLDVSGRVRLPTGDDDKGLGSGATDYITKAELGWLIGRGGVYASGARRFLGDANGFNRQDGWQASAGAWVNPVRRTTLGAYYDWRESSTGIGEDPSEVGAFASYKLTDEIRVGMDFSAGLSDGSPDYGVGLSLSYRANLTPK